MTPQNEHEELTYEAHGYTEQNGVRKLAITKDRYNEIRRARDLCIAGLDIEEKFTLLVDNYYEFETELLKFAQQQVIWDIHEHEITMSQRLLLDRRIANFLMSARLYLDQTDHEISGIFGNPSAVLAHIKDFKNKLYDNNFDYRLMEALRNHVQHAAMLIHSISFSASAIGKNGVMQTVIPYALVRDLLDNKSFNKKIISELEANKCVRIDLRPSIRSYVSYLAQLHEEIRNVIRIEVDQARALYTSAKAQYSQIDGMNVSLPYVLMLNAKSGKKEEVYLGGDSLKYYDALIKKNKMSKQLSRSCASNAYQKPSDTKH